MQITKVFQGTQGSFKIEVKWKRVLFSPKLHLKNEYHFISLLVLLNLQFLTQQELYKHVTKMFIKKFNYHKK